MMKKLFFPLTLLTVLCVWAYSCKKSETLAPNYAPDHGDLQYTIKGVRDTFLEQTGTLQMHLFVERTAGKFEDVNLSLADAPEGLTAEFKPQSAVAPYNTTLVLNAKQVDEGNYTVKIVGASATTGLKYFDMKVRVLPYTNPALALEGNFIETRKCSQSPDSFHNVTIQPLEGSVGKVSIRGIWVGGGAYTVIANVNQSTQTVSIPRQTVNKLRFEGGGTYTKNQMELLYSVLDTASFIINDNCTSTFAKQ